MALDRNRMAELHEQYAADLFGGQVSRASGSTWTNQGDGENNRMDVPFAFTWDCKATRGKGITIDLAMIAKITEQAGGNRPAIPLRWYGTDDLRRVTADWVAIPAADLGELLVLVRQAARFASTDQEVTVGVPVLAPEPPAFFPKAVLHGSYPADLPVPPHELWPCLVIDSRHDPDSPEQHVTNSGYFISDGGVVSSYGINSCRVERATGQENRVFVNETLIQRAQLYVDGQLRVTTGMPRR